MQSQEQEKKYTFCRICESLCGLEVTVEGNKVVKIRPDQKHVATRGFGCPKGLKQHHLFSSPDRLKYPLHRVGKEWQRVSWDAAYKGIGEKVRQILKESGPDSIAMYVGTAAGFGVLHPAFAQGFMQGIGSKSMYASATQDCSNKFAVAEHMYGFPFTQYTFLQVDLNSYLFIGIFVKHQTFTNGALQRIKQGEMQNSRWQIDLFQGKPDLFLSGNSLQHKYLPSDMTDKGTPIQ